MGGFLFTTGLSLVWSAFCLYLVWLLFDKLNIIIELLQVIAYGS